MLGGEDLGGGHERGLVAVLHGDDHGLECDDRLARADVALQKAAHGVGQAHVGNDLAEGTLLGGGGMKRQHFADGFADLVGSGEGDAGAVAHAAALELQPQFEKEQLLENQAAVRGGGGRPAVAAWACLHGENALRKARSRGRAG